MAVFNVLDIVCAIIKSKFIIEGITQLIIHIIGAVRVLAILYKTEKLQSWSPLSIGYIIIIIMNILVHGPVSAFKNLRVTLMIDKCICVDQFLNVLN